MRYLVKIPDSLPPTQSRIDTCPSFTHHSPNTCAIAPQWYQTTLAHSPSLSSPTYTQRDCKTYTMKNSARKSKLIALLSALVGLFLGVVLSNLNNNDRKDAEHYIRILEEEEEEDEVNPVLDFTILSCIVLLLIFLTILFELLKDHAEEHASRNAKPIVEALFGELTVLGFLSVFTFVATHTGILQKLGEHLLGPARHEDVLEAFESVHYTIFFIMVFFVIQVLVLVKEASETEELWLEYERIVVAASNACRFRATHVESMRTGLSSSIQYCRYCREMDSILWRNTPLFQSTRQWSTCLATLQGSAG